MLRRNFSRAFPGCQISPWVSRTAWVCPPILAACRDWKSQHGAGEGGIQIANTRGRSYETSSMSTRASSILMRASKWTFHRRFRYDSLKAEERIFNFVAIPS